MRNRRMALGASLVGIVVALGVLASCGSQPEADATTTTSQIAVTTTTAPAVDKAKFQDAWRAYKKIEAAQTVGVSYSEFAPLVQDYVTELSLIPQDGLSTQESAVLIALYDIAQAYLDSYSLWERKIDQTDYESTKMDGALVSCIIAIGGGHYYVPEADRIISAYGLRTGTKEVSIAGKPYLMTLVPKDSFRDVWTWASAKGESLGSILAP
jgi:hypothetical protein